MKEIQVETEATIKDLYAWIRKELKEASNNQTESILPAVIEATAKLIDAVYY